MRRNAFRKQKNKNKSIAQERIEILFKEAAEVFNKDKNLANRYVGLAREIAMKYKVKLSKEQKRQLCNKCHSFLVPGKNLMVRARKGKIVYHCLECKHMMRFHH